MLNHLASLAKWLSVRLRTKWLWVRVLLQSLENVCLENSKEEVILGITIDNKLTLDSHIKSIRRKMHFLEYHHTLKQIKKNC